LGLDDCVEWDYGYNCGGDGLLLICGGGDEEDGLFHHG
jgi:hypothetical protein